MTRRFQLLILPWVGCFLAWGLLVPGRLQAEEPKVEAATLSAAPWGSLPEDFPGLARLTEAQRTQLQRYVWREIKRAEQGAVRGFAGAFTSRLLVSERAAVGLVNLTDDERKRLDLWMSQTLRDRPEPQAFAKAETPAAAESPLITEERPEVRWHGAVSLTYGVASGGGTLKAGSLDLQADLPNGAQLGLRYQQIQTSGARLGPCWTWPW